jgi:cell division protein ZapA (FtsZ GTPase activity inhibitor)
MTLAKSALATLLGAAIVAAPTFAQTPEEQKKALENAVQKLEQAAKDLKDAKDAMKTDDLKSKAITIDTKLDMLDKDIQDIKKDVREIRRQMGERTSTALRPDYDSATFRGTGRVRFINQFSEEMSVVVNGRSFRLQPGEERLVPVPPGEFTYQVLQLQRVPQERRISADETKTVRIYPIP